MTKRIFSMLLVMAMVLSMLPLGVMAEGSGTPAQTTAEKYTKYGVLASHEHVADDAHICEHCVAAGATDTTPEWIAWGDDDAEKTQLPTATGHYYIVSDLSKMATSDLSSGKDKDVVLCLNGKSLNCNDAYNVSNRFYTLGSTNKLTVLDCTAHYDSNGNYVAGSFNNATYTTIMFKYEMGNATFTMYDGIMNNSTQRGANGGAVKAGGAILVQGPSRVNLYGGEIRNAKASSGGAIRLYSKGAVLDIDGATITGCSVNTTGSAITASENNDKSGSNPTRITIKNATITGNTSAAAGDACGGAIYVAGNTAVVTLGGNNQITGNTDKNGAEYNLFLYNNAAGQPKYTVSDLSSTARMGIRVHTDRLGAEGGLTLSTALNGADVAANFVADNEGYEVKAENDALVLAVKKQEGHTHKVCNQLTCEDGHENVTYQKWESTTSLPTSGNYYLTGDVTLSAQTDLNATTLNLCLNGHTVKTAAGKSIRHFMLANNAKLVLSNCDAENEGVLTGGKASSIMTNSSASNASAIELYNIVLKGNSYTGGGAVMLQGKSSLKAVSCKFNDNTGTSSSGAMRLYGTGATTLIDCEVKGNTAPTMSAIRLDNGTLTLIDTVIEGNTATKAGDASYGAVYMTNSNTRKLTVSGATRITGNTDKDGKPYNVFFQNSVGYQGVLTVDGLSGNALIGVTLQAARLGAADGMAITAKLSGANPVEFLASDNETYMPLLRDDVVILGSVAENTHKHNVCGEAGCAEHGQVAYQPWDSATSLPTSGNYFLTKDVTLSAQTRLSGTTLNLCLNGHTVTVKAGSGTRHFYLEKSAKLTISNCNAEKDGILTGGQASAIMTANVSDNKAQLELYNVVLQGNKYSGGGAMMIQGAADVKLVGCKLLNNSATGVGGAIRHYGSGTVTLIGCEVKGNTAKTTSAIRMENGLGKLVLIDTVIEGNSTTTDDALNYGALYAPSSKYTITLEGQTCITGNTDKAGNPANVYLRYDSSGNPVLTVGEKGLSGNAKIHVTVAEDRLIQNGNAVTRELGGKDYSAFFASDVKGFQVAFVDDKIILEDHNDYNHNHKLCNDEKCNDHGNVLVFKPWKDATKLPTAAGNYFLATDVQLKAVCALSKDVNLCLNGFTITPAKNERTFAVSPGATLSVTDCTGNGKITGGVRNFGGVINVNQGAIFNLFGGSLTGNQTVAMTNENGKAGAVYLTKAVDDQPGGVFNMYGGSISENKSFMGGAVLVCDGATMNLYGGTIANNATIGRGGAIVGDGKATINIHGGTISGNTASKGAGIYVRNGAHIEMIGGVITKNKTNATFVDEKQIEKASGAAAISLTNQSTMTMSGGEISYNEGKGAGGAILIESKDSKLTLKGGKIIGNTSTSDGGAIYVSTNTVFEMTGGEIKNNQSRLNGGGVYFLRSTGTISGGSINSNYSTEGAGAGIGMARATVTIKGGSVSYNMVKKATGAKGAGIMVNGSTLNIYGGSIVGNKLPEKGTGGAAICTSTSSSTTNGVKTTYYSKINMYGGTIANHEGNYGGAILLQSKTVMNMSGGTMRDNYAPKEGGAVCLYSQSQFHMSGGTMQGNKTDSRGGCVKFNAGTSGSFTGGTLTGNYAGQYGGVFNAHGIDCKVVVKDMKIYGNECKNYGGAIAITWNAVLDMDNCEFYENKAGEGGAMYLAHKTTCYLDDVKVYKNYSSDAGGAFYLDVGNNINFTNVKILDNESVSNGGAIYTRANLHLKDCLIDGNKSGKDGGAIATSAAWTYGNDPAYTNGYIGRGQGTIIENTVISNNTCVGRGGGAFMAKKNWNTIIDSEFTGNTSGETGSALFVGDDLLVKGMTVTGNKSLSNGYAVYFRENSYDGQSYMQAIHEIGGNVIVKDNEGGDVMLCAKVVLGNIAEGYGEDTYMNVELSDGLLTDRIAGEYGYEGSGLCYTVTYGDRSYMEPMEKEVQEETTELAATGDTWLYVGVGAFVAVVAALVVLILAKKKKAGKAAAETPKE